MKHSQVTQEMLKKAQTAKSAEELLTLAKDNGVTLEPTEAQTLFAALERSKNGELTEDELGLAAGGRNTDVWYDYC